MTEHRPLAADDGLIVERKTSRRYHDELHQRDDDELELVISRETLIQTTADYSELISSRGTHRCSIELVDLNYLTMEMDG